jgi:hypothetical protein
MFQKKNGKVYAVLIDLEFAVSADVDDCYVKW